MSRQISAIVAMLLAACVGGCGAFSEKTAGSMWVTPGKYDYNNCKQIVGIAQSHRTRQEDLQALMAKAAQGTGGQFIGSLAYRTEYLQAVGDEKAAMEAFELKRCRSESNRVSDRSMF